MKLPRLGPVTPGHAMRVLKGTNYGWLAGVLAVVALVVIGSVVLGDEIDVRIHELRVWIGQLGPWGVIVFMALLVLGTSLLLPESLFSVTAGVVFGLGWGIVAAVAGNVLAAAFQYALSRWLFRQRVQLAVDRRPSFSAIQRAVMKDQLRLQFLLRLTPLNPAAMSYLLGASGVRFGTFVFACLGLLPHVCLEVYLGSAGRHLVGATTTTTTATQAARVHDLMLIGGIVVAVSLIASISKIARNAVLGAVSNDDNGAG